MTDKSPPGFPDLPPTRIVGEVRDDGIVTISSSGIEVRRYPLGAMTAEDVVELGRSLSIYCEKCRMSRRADAASFGERAYQPLAQIAFRCGTCGELGRPMVSGWENGCRASWG